MSLKREGGEKKDTGNRGEVELIDSSLVAGNNTDSSWLGWQRAGGLRIQGNVGELGLEKATDQTGLESGRRNELLTSLGLCPWNEFAPVISS